MCSDCHKQPVVPPSMLNRRFTFLILDTQRHHRIRIDHGVCEEYDRQLIGNGEHFTGFHASPLSSFSRSALPLLQPVVNENLDVFPLCVLPKKSASHFLYSFLIADLSTDRCIDSYIFRQPNGVEGRRRSQRMSLAMQRSVVVFHSLSL